MYERLAMRRTSAVLLPMLIDKASAHSALLCFSFSASEQYMILDLSAPRLGLLLWATRTGVVCAPVDECVFMHSCEDVVDRVALAVISVLEA